MDIRSDLYSLGVTLWVIVTGRTPFRGPSAELMYQHQHAPLPLEQLTDVPQPLIVLLEKLLEKDPARRFQTPNELLKAIPRIMGALDTRRRITRQSLQKMPFTASSRGTLKPRATVAPKKISVARLPVTGGNVFGREEDIAFLDRAWANRDVNIAIIIAWAGVGKSTLVNHWLRGMANNHYRSAELIFGWSFYRQGARGDTSSADEFLDAALTWFGDPDPRVGPAWGGNRRCGFAGSLSLSRCVTLGKPRRGGRSGLISLVVHLGHNGSVLSSMTTDEKLDWIIETLKRMEARQVELKTGVDDVQAHEPPTVGSFASVNTGKKD